MIKTQAIPVFCSITGKLTECHLAPAHVASVMGEGAVPEELLIHGGKSCINSPVGQTTYSTWEAEKVVAFLNKA